MKKFIILFAVLIVAGCSKNDDGLDPNGPSVVLEDVVTQNFMWRASNLWYFWQADVPNLADERLTNDFQEYLEFLDSEASPGAFFDNQLRFVEDRFTYYSADYKELTNSLGGIEQNNGMEFKISYNDANGNNTFDGSDPGFGYVIYVLPGSNAATTSIQRGDLFTAVDGQNITGANYRDLLFGENATYTLTMADLVDGTLTPNGTEITLTKEENFQEDPLHVVTTLDVNGQKIGYLMYNRFLNEYDEQLNAAFGNFLSDGITDLVVDLRYNPGGSVNTSRLLASMIYGTNTNDLYLRERWNPKIEEAFTSGNPNALEQYFANQTGDGTSLNTLNLNRVYIITTGFSASASELLINCLDPYMEVITIGRTTRGKNEFSLTMVDDEDRNGAPFVYTPSREGNINPDNPWAMQLILGRNENAAGFSDYTAGLPPDISQSEDLENMGVLGDVNEPLLARALSEITGVSGKQSFDVMRPANPVYSSRIAKPMRDIMLLDREIRLPEIPKQ
ncbi:S41 family peptidase [Robiginitalea sp. IMCC43444]|uniref:S41 family peptidase n=1 Tax=Robiginitalea sp. IMCC43444 TaxID=3459121 RepID=UPI00404392F9